MNDLPTAEVMAVQLRRDGPPQCLGRVTVKCPYCRHLHRHRVFTNDTIIFTRTGPCSTDADIRKYTVDLNTCVPRRDVSQEHPVYTPHRDDNAIDDPVPNWTE